ncbi:uncharacterized protein PG986_010743 [Apiospora aurea]|uniref:Uncharacterized protein n=1 Tax=Apiospora aurea TaxID=335848 RepID=A0ABR1Q389_9PEZI
MQVSGSNGNAILGKGTMNDPTKVGVEELVGWWDLLNVMARIASLAVPNLKLRWGPLPASRASSIEIQSPKGLKCVAGCAKSRKVGSSQRERCSSIAELMDATQMPESRSSV